MMGHFPADKRSNTDLALKLVLFSTAAIVGAFLIYQLKMLIICLLLAMTLAAAIAPVAEAGEKWKIPRLITVMAVYISAAAIYAALAALLAPTIREQWHKLTDNLPAYMSLVNGWYQEALATASNNAPAQALSFADVKTLTVKLIHQTVDMSAGLVGLLLNVFLTLFLSAYIVVEAKDIYRGLLRWLPPNFRETATNLIVPISSRMGGYVRGQLLVALGACVFLVLGLSIAGVRYALVLGILAGVLNVVPYIGSFIACSFAVVVAFNQMPYMALSVLLVYGLEQWVESTFLVPFFVGKQALLHPIIVLLAILAGAKLVGVPGAIIAVPLASALVYLGEEFYVRSFENPISEAQAPPSNRLPD